MFGVEHDPNIKFCVKNSMTVEECVARGGIQEALDKIKPQIIAEFGQEDTAPGQVAGHGLGPSDAPTLFAIAAGAVASADVSDLPEEIAAAVKQQSQRADTIERLPEEGTDLVQAWQAKALQKVSDGVQLLVEPDSATLLQQMISETYVGSVRGDDCRYVLCVYDCKLAGESQTAPYVRTPAFKHDRLKKCFSAVRQQRGDEKLPDGDLWMLFDAGAHGNKSVMLNQFQDSEGKAFPKSVWTLHLVYSEQSVAKKLKRTASSQVHQLEYVHMVTQAPLRFLKKDRSYFENCTNAGDVLTPIAMPQLADQWLATFQDKRAMYGNMRTPVGGAVETEHGSEPGQKRKRLDNDVEPMTYHGMIPEVYKELLHSHPAVAVMDFTACDGMLAAVCLELGVPYLGVVFSERHKEGLINHLAHYVFNAMMTETHQWYAAPLAAVLAKAPAQEKPQATALSQDSDDAAAAKKPAETAKASAKSKAKTKASGQSSKAAGAAKAASAQGKSASSSKDAADRAKLLARLAELGGESPDDSASGEADAEQ